MPILHIEFDATGGTLFEIKYKPSSGTVWQTQNATGSPVDITIPTNEPYDYCIKKICSPSNNSIDICGTAAYIPPCATPEFTFDSRIGNNFAFNYLLVGAQPQFDIEITAPLGGGTTITRYQSATNPSPLHIIIPNIQTGLYRFRMRGVCGVDINSAVSNWSAYADVDIVVNSCQAPSAILANNYPNYYGGASGLGGNLFQIQNYESITRTLADVQPLSATRYSVLQQSKVYENYTGSAPFGDIIIQSIPDRGSLYVSGSVAQEITTVPHAISILSIDDFISSFQFYPMNFDNSGVFEDFTTSFEYIILDVYGNQIDLVTLEINFTAAP